MRTLILISSCSAIFAALAPCTTAAQTHPRHTCFRGQTADRCHSWIELEASGALRAGGTDHLRANAFGPPGARVEDLTSYGSLGLGYMVNTSATHAAGGLLQAGGGESGVRLAAVARSRSWLTKRSSLDVDFGLLSTQQQDVQTNGTTQAYGVTAATSLGYSDLVGLTLSADAARGSGHNAFGAHVGLKVGSYPAAATLLAAPIVGLMLANSLKHAFGGCCSGLIT